MEDQSMCNIQFEDQFFLTEIREGFEVEGLLKRAWASQMEVLAEIEKICEKHNISWYADYGTLLGVVRHKGFIPWDDDIDISMMREDYDRFIAVSEKELPKDYKVMYAGAAEYNRREFLRVTNTDCVTFDKDFLDKYHGCPYVCGVDIFPLDGVPDDEEEWDILKQLVKMIIDAESLMHDWNIENAGPFLDEIETICGIQLDRENNLSKQLYILVDALCRSYTVAECERIASIVTAWHDNSARKKSWYDNVTMMPFENIEIPVPVEFDNVLKTIYGNDYMVPVQGVQLHDFPFYVKQKKDAYSALDMKPGHNNRERRVAQAMKINESEVFEYKYVEGDGEGSEYIYFCQCKMIQLWIPDDETKSIKIIDS